MVSIYSWLSRAFQITRFSQSTNTLHDVISREVFITSIRVGLRSLFLFLCALFFALTFLYLLASAFWSPLFDSLFIFDSLIYYWVASPNLFFIICSLFLNGLLLLISFLLSVRFFSLGCFSLLSSAHYLSFDISLFCFFSKPVLMQYIV